MVSGSGGPKTALGKAIVSQNAIKHGILSGVVPQHEAAAYREHVKRVHEHYQPVGYLEEILTERVATALWRLLRVVRFESSLLQAAIDQRVRQHHQPQSLGIDSGPWFVREHPDDIRADHDDLTRCLAVHELGPSALQVANSADLEIWVLGAWSVAFATKGSTLVYQKAMRAISRMHGIRRKDWHWLDQASSREPLDWSYQKAEKAVALLLGCSGKITLPRDWTEASSRFEDRLVVLARDLSVLAESHVALHAQESIPAEAQVVRLVKYEAHIDRTLYRALHELDAQQDKRHGRQVPTALIDLRTD